MHPFCFTQSHDNVSPGRAIASLSFLPANPSLLTIAAGHKVPCTSTPSPPNHQPHQQLYVWDYNASPKHAPVTIYKAPRSLRAVRLHPMGAPLLLTAELMEPTPAACLPTAATHAEHMSRGTPSSEAVPVKTRSRRPSAFAGAASAAIAEPPVRQSSHSHDAMPRVPSTHGFALPGEEGSPGGSLLARAISSGSLLATLQEEGGSMPRVTSRSLLSAGIGVTRENSTRGSVDTDGLLADASAGSMARALVHAASQSMDDDVFGLAELGATIEPCQGGTDSADTPPRSPDEQRGSEPSDEGSSETSPQQQRGTGEAGGQSLGRSLGRSAPLPIRTGALMSRWLQGAG